MKIEILELFKDGGQTFQKDEVRVVSKPDGERYCSLGWAKDVSGKVKTGERKPGVSDLKIDNVAQDQKSEVK